MSTKKSLNRLLISVLTAAAIAATVCTTALADSVTDSGTGEVTGTINITGTISPLTISVTHPATETYAIDPNTGTFTAPPIQITNNTKVAVNVSVQSLHSISGGSIQFTDVSPTAENWSNLSSDDAKKYIALGMKINNPDGWLSSYNTSTDWAADNSPITFGSLPSATTGNLALTADYGLAFDSSYTAQHALEFMFNLV